MSELRPFCYLLYLSGGLGEMIKFPEYAFNRMLIIL